MLTLTFLAHQALLSMDAVVRTMVRRLITRQRLLEWETAAEAERAGVKKLRWMSTSHGHPSLALSVFFLLWLARPRRYPSSLAHPSSVGLQQTNFHLDEPASPRSAQAGV